MPGNPDLAQARGYGELAYRMMAAHEVAPTPQNYAIWFAYSAGTEPELKRAIDVVLANRQPLTPELHEELYARHFEKGGHASLLEETGGRMHDLMNQVRQLMGAAAGDAANFGSTLDTFTTAIGKSGGGDKMRSLIADLVKETQRVAERNRALEERLNRASGEVTELRQNLELVQREALTDGLTGIPNRKSFDARLKDETRESTENGEPLSLLLLDIDHFKHFNDMFGHPIGDQVLRLVARTLTDSVKGRDTCARYGGEEFAIILPQTRLEHAFVVADQIRNTMMRRKLVGKDTKGSYGTVTLSLGAAQFRPGEPLADLIRRADAALYFAKRTGRNKVATEAMLPSEAVAS